MLKFKGCMNFEACPSAIAYLEVVDAKFCEDCGDELQPYPVCACGKGINLKVLRRRLKVNQKTFCEGCGQPLDKQTIGPILSQNVRQMVSQLAAQKSQN